MSARNEIGHWLNELPNRDVDRRALAELCADYDAVYAALRWHIRVYRVADEAWNPEAETDRIMKLALSEVTPNGYLREVLESNAAAIRNQNEA